jgi:hypothetical protein
MALRFRKALDSDSHQMSILQVLANLFHSNFIVIHFKSTGITYPLGMAIATAIRDYGALCRDTAGNPVLYGITFYFILIIT